MFDLLANLMHISYLLVFSFYLSYFVNLDFYFVYMLGENCSALVFVLLLHEALPAISVR